MSGHRAVVTHGQDGEGRTVDPPDRLGVDGHAEEFDHVDQRERGRHLTVRGGESEFDGLVAQRVERHQLGGHVVGRVVVEATGQGDDALGEQSGGHPVVGSGRRPRRVADHCWSPVSDRSASVHSMRRPRAVA